MIVSTLFKRLPSLMARPIQIRLYTKENSTSPPQQPEPQQPEQTTEDLNLQKIAQLQDLYRRALADAENIRTRSKKEVLQAKQFAISKFSKDLLETNDILKMALESVPQAEIDVEGNKSLKDLYTGVVMTRKELIKTFKRHGLEEFDPIGEKFDENLHEALFQAPVEGKKPGTVFQTSKIGYTLNGRCLRPAQVGVVQDTTE